MRSRRLIPRRRLLRRHRLICRRAKMLNKSTSTCEAQKEYFKLVFDTCCPEKERIAAAFKEAHEIRQFEIRLYWQRNLFFWGFILTFFASFVALLTNENQKDFMWALLGIALIGLFTSLAWFYIEKGSGTWQKNWELHIDFLEDRITGKLHKTMLGEEGQFLSLATILRHFIFSVGVVWFVLFLVVASLVWTELKCVFVAIGEWLVLNQGVWTYLLLLVIVMGFVYPKIYWETSDRTLGIK